MKKSIQIDNDLKSWFLDNDPALSAYHDFHDKFGNDEVLILVIHDELGLFTKEWQGKFNDLHRSIAGLNYIQDVFGPVEQAIFSSGHQLILNQSINERSEPTELRQFFNAIPTLRKLVYNDDFSTARFIIRFKILDDLDQKRFEYLADLKEKTDAIINTSQVYRGGMGVVFGAINDLSQRDFGLFLTLGYLLILLCMFVIYRQVLVVVYAFTTVALAIWFTLGLYGYAGNQLNMLTVLMPIIITLLGVMDIMHVLNEYSMHDIQSNGNTTEAVKALKRIFQPCLFTTLTTMASFLALLSSPMHVLREFGLHSAIGIFFSLFFTYIVGFMLLPHIKPSQNITMGLSNQLARFFSVLQKHKLFFVGLLTIAIIIGSIGIKRVHSDNNSYSYLPEDHPVVMDHNSIESLWGPYMQYEVIVNPKEEYELFDPEVVNSIQALSDSVRNIKGIGSVFGFNTLYEMFMEARYPNDRQYMMNDILALTEAHFYFQEHMPKILAQYIHEPSGSGRLTFTGGMLSANEVKEKTDELLRLSDFITTEYAEITPSGFIPMYSSIVRYINISQINSLLLAVGLIFLMILYFVRNLRLALISVLPNFFPIIMMFAVMGWFGINVDNATVSFAAIALSFCIDDTIHFIFHYKKLRGLNQSVNKSVINTLSNVGTVILLTSMVLFFGFVLMTFGELKTVFYFGLLISVAIISALFVQIAIFPLLLCHFDKEEELKPAPE